MITEDYCSQEVIQLLEEKGFKYGHCGTYVWDEGDLLITHQTVMKWLREKGIHMSVDTVISSSGSTYYNIDVYTEPSGWVHVVEFYSSYEEAIEKALKYSLKNLI